MSDSWLRFGLGRAKARPYNEADLLQVGEDGYVEF